MKAKLFHSLIAIALTLTQFLFPLQLLVSAASPVAITKPDTVTGTIEGEVLDAAGNGIPGVRVKATNIDTGNVRTVQTNARGFYRITFLPLGRYMLEAFKDGFRQEATQPPTRIKLNDTVFTAPPIRMVSGSGPAPIATNTPPPVTPTPQPQPPPTTPAAVAEDTGQATNQNDPTRRSNADEKMVSLLPLSGVRTFDDLAFLAAGVAPPPQVRGVAGPGIGAGIGTPGQFSVNGQRARSNNFTVDGSDNNDEDVGVRRQGFVALTPQSIESVKEIQIVTHLWDAEQGRSMGSQVNAVSKSGTNQIHGTVYNFFNDSALNARNFFDYKDDKAKSFALSAQAVDRYTNGQPVNARAIPVVVRNSSSELPTPLVQANPSEGEDRYRRFQGGATLGLPIYRDRTFFFGSIEGQSIGARQETHFAVPTVAQRGFLGYGATGFTTRDRQGNAQVFTPTSVAGDSVMSLFPFPNNPVGPYGANTLTQVLPADARGLIYSLKVDHNFKLFGPEVTHQFTARYNFTDDSRQIPAVGGAIFSGVEPDVRTNNLSLFLNSQLSPTKANQLRASYGRTALRFDEVRNSYLAPSSFLPNEQFLLNARKIGNGTTPEFVTNFVDYRRLSGQVSEDNLSTVGQVLVYPFSPLGTDVYLFPQARANNTIQFADTFSYVRVNHTFKFGADIRRTQLNSFLNRNYRSQVVFGGSPDLTAQFGAAPIQNISQFGPTPGFFSGSDLASLAIPTGIFQSLAIGNADSTLGLRFWQLNGFFNDNWKVRRGLTLDLGLRYEINTVPRDVNSRIENTFPLNQLPTSDPNIAIAAPFTNGARIYPNASLLTSFNSTVSALKNIIGSRDSIFDSDRNNFGGHVGFAWDPFASDSARAGKTIVRGGVGAYYDVALGSVVSQSRNVFPNSLPINVDANTFSYASDAFFVPGTTGIIGIFNPRYIQLDLVNNGRLTPRVGLIRPDQLNVLQAPSGALPQLLGLLFDPTVAGSLPSGGGIAFTLPDRNLRSPYALQYNLQVERELYKDFLVNLAYVGSRGINLTRFRTPNGGPNSVTLPIDPLGINPSPVLAIALAPLSSLGGANLRRPNPNLGAYTVFDSSAASNYHSLQLSVNKRFSQGYQFGAAYTWSHAIDDVSDVFDVAGAYALPQDDRNLLAERASANFDVRHRLAISSIGDLPGLARYNNSKGIKGAMFGGWQYSLFATFQTGQPFTVNSSYDVNLDGNFTDRIDSLNGLAIIDDRQQKLGLNASPTQLLAALGNNGRIGRNFFRAGGVARTDLAFVKNFSVTDRQVIVFRVEAFNLANRTHFAIPVRVLEAPSFGKSVDTTVGARQIQFALKYVF